MSVEKLEESDPSLGKKVNKIGFLGEVQVRFACTSRRVRPASLDQQVSSCQIPEDSDWKWLGLGLLVWKSLFQLWLQGIL